jgi:hypothetical protein
MWGVAFWKQAGERAARTFAQVLLSMLVVGETGFLDVDWVQALSVSGLAALASVLMSVSATGFGDQGTPSYVREDKS